MGEWEIKINVTDETLDAVCECCNGNRTKVDLDIIKTGLS